MERDLFCAVLQIFDGRWVFAAEPKLSLVAVTGGSSLVVVLRLLIAVASLVALC